MILDQKFEETYTHEWERIRTCVDLLRRKQAHIVVKTYKSGKRSRYTRIIGR